MSGLQEVAPSPIHDTPQVCTKGEYFPADNKASPASSRSNPTGKGLSGHSTTWWLHRVQKYSSYVFSAFLGLHITNTSIIPLFTQSIPASDTYLLLTRPYYQSPLFEPLMVIAPLLLHIGSGVAVRLRRRHQVLEWAGAQSRAERRITKWPKVSATSGLGYALTGLLSGHIFVNRVLPLIVDGGSSGVGLQYFAHGIAKMPVVLNLGYMAFLGVAISHIVLGVSKWQGWLPEHTSDAKTKKQRSWTIAGVIAAVSGLWAAGGLGVIGRGGVSRGWQGKHFDAILAKAWL